MRFLKFIVPILLVFQIAVFAQSFKKSSVKTFAAENCKTVGKDPLVTVCVESATEGAKFSKRLGRALKKAVRELVENFDSELAADPVPNPDPNVEDYCYGVSCMGGDYTPECCEF